MSERGAGARIEPREAAPRRIVSIPEICGGEPTFEGTRIPVRCVIVEYQQHRDLQRVRDAYPRLDIPTIEAALAYYQAHRGEIDQLIKENEEAAYAAD